MWPAPDTLVQYQLAGECPSCGRDLPGALPRLPMADPDLLKDAEVVALWRFWTQAFHRTAGRAGDPQFVADFRLWLSRGSIDEPPPVELEPWEHEFLRMFRAGAVGGVTPSKSR